MLGQKNSDSKTSVLILRITIGIISNHFIPFPPTPQKIYVFKYLDLLICHRPEKLLLDGSPFPLPSRMKMYRNYSLHFAKCLEIFI